MIVCYQYRIQKYPFPTEYDFYKFYNSNQMDGKVWSFGSLKHGSAIYCYPISSYEFPICAWKIKQK